MPEIRDMKARVGDLLERMPKQRLYDEAKNQGFSNLSHFLEAEDPSSPEERRAGLDAFTRMLSVADIVTVSDRYGSYYADPVEKFSESDATRAIFPEWCRRQWDGNHPLTQRAQAMYLSSDFAVGTIQNPTLDDPGEPSFLQIEPAIPLTEMVARTRGVDRRDVRRRVITVPAAADIRMLRVAEATEIPRAKITENSAINRLAKFARALEGSYEALRNMPIDELQMHIRLLALQNEVDQVAVAADTMVNGDGSTNSSAETFNLTALDSTTTAGNLTPAAWLAFVTKWANPFALTHVVGQQAMILKLLMLNIGTANVLMSGVPSESGFRQAFTPINNRLSTGVRFGILDTAPANQLIGFDSRFAIEHLRLTGFDIAEADRWITRQTEVMTFSFWEAFATAHPDAAKILVMNA
jgi:hypothetical protein